MGTPWPQEWIAPVLRLAREAGALILAERARGLSVVSKPDGSPQSNADHAAERHIVSGLLGLAPAIPVLAEESIGAAAPFDPRSPFWLVDPLDGTKSFVAGTDDFTVNIALVTDTRPVFGVIYAPARGELFWNDAAQVWFQGDEQAARVIRSRKPPMTGLTMITSRRTYTGPKLQLWMRQQHITEQMMLSSALKFGYVAMGRADIYPRLGKTMEWDNAAGEAILQRAGGSVLTPEGQPLLYGQPPFEHDGLIARGFVVR